MYLKIRIERKRKLGSKENIKFNKDGSTVAGVCVDVSFLIQGGIFASTYIKTEHKRKMRKRVETENKIYER